MKDMRRSSAFSAFRTGRRRLAAVTSMAMIAAAFALVSAPAASAAAPPGPYFNGFENASDVAVRPPSNSNDVMFNVTRETSGTDGILSSAGGHYAQTVPALGDGSQFTRYGGYSSFFPPGGYTTSIDIYLDMADSDVGEDTRFDWSSAINGTDGNHQRDFIFSVGTNGLGGFVMSASNNTPGWPANPGRDPLTVTTTGWYTFQHTFRDDGAGVLAVDMSVLDASGNVLKMWTLSDSADIISTEVGGNRYGSFFNNGFSSLAIDDITRSGSPALGPCPVAITGSNPTTYTLLADCITDQTIVVPQHAGGTVFEGNGKSITAVDPAGDHFKGAVVEAEAGPDTITVQNLTVKTQNLVDACDAGDDRLRGILFEGVSGAITDNTVTDLEQGPTGQSGCQEGNAIDVRNTAGVTPRPNVTISGNDVSDYQKTGIIATLSTVTTITNNIVTGDGSIAYIAENGIQVSFKATAKLVGNDVSLNNYSPPKVVACGLLIYKAGGVSGATKSGLAFVKADNNFHNNEQNVCNFGKGGTFSPDA
jgi:hypothetical protein